jgi:hypothetical protein
MKPPATASVLLVACAAIVFADPAYGGGAKGLGRNLGEPIKEVANGELIDDAVRLAPLLMGLFGKLAGVVTVVSAGIYLRDEKRRQAALIAYLVAIVGGAWTAYAWLGLPFVRQAGPRQWWAAWLDGPGPDAVALSFTGLIGLAAFAAGGVGICALIARVLGDEPKQSGP